MLFNSGIFLFVFLPVTLLGYVLLSRVVHEHWLYGWLICASLFFYGWWYPPYLLLLIFSILFNYQIGRQLRQRKTHRKLWLLTGITINLGLIAYFKYANFFLDNVNALTGLHYVIAHIALPLAISFFTFQQIAYLVDSYRSTVLPHNFLSYSLFVSFFPQLIAGPIVHHGQFFEQLENKLPSLNVEKSAIGISIFFFGLFKKVVIADQLAFYATPVFNNAGNGKILSFFEAWAGVLSYTNQLYFDFSGYSDMAIGLALLFGIYLPINFNSPYKATSIIDFWRRWHITLSHFLRDYLYIALGGNRKGQLQRYINLLLTMVLGGLWHGASWTFVAWGALHGIYLMINHLWRSLLARCNIRQIVTSTGYRITAFLLTYFAVIVAWVFFRAETFPAALSILRSMLGLNGISLPPALAPYAGVFDGSKLIIFQGAGIQGGSQAVFWIITTMLITLTFPNTQQLMRRWLINPINPDIPYRGSFSWQPNLRYALLLSFVAAAALIMVIVGRSSEFLYFQF